MQVDATADAVVAAVVVAVAVVVPVAAMPGHQAVQNSLKNRRVY